MHTLYMCIYSFAVITKCIFECILFIIEVIKKKLDNVYIFNCFFPPSAPIPVMNSHGQLYGCCN